MTRNICGICFGKVNCKLLPSEFPLAQFDTSALMANALIRSGQVSGFLPDSVQIILL